MERYRSTLRRAATIAGMGAIFGTSTVVAGTGVGAVFNLGVANSTTKTTTLSTNVDGPALAIGNANPSPSAAGLRISVPAGRAPISVSTTAGKATNLNADKLDGLDSTSFARRALPPWRVVGTTGQPGFEGTCGVDGRSCPWGHPPSDYTSQGYGTVSFMKDSMGFVHLRGLATCTGPSSSGTCSGRLFTLPPGYRPVTRGAFLVVWFWDRVARLDILLDGSVLMHGAGTYWTSMPDLVSLEGIRFQTAP